MPGAQPNMQQTQPGMQPQAQPGMAPNGLMSQPQPGMPPVSQPAAHVNPAFFPGGQPPQVSA